ncbi:MAG: hypothetical protein SAL07_10605 [Oscillatoria sp. PMC 1051.18]|nr:hypothetical protein [Oscillatoria sp. PMC 1050.18]MEC5030354.1 hypothetical protein [Oscillatoria sp. PMC 1051.18]
MNDNNLEDVTKQVNYSSQALLETFDSWEDERTTEEIINDIYSSRTNSSNRRIL